MKLRQHRRDLVRRIGWFNAAIQVALVIVALAYWRVQIADGAEYRVRADDNRLRRLSIEAPRGLIRDRHGQPLAENVPSYGLDIDRSRSEDLERSVRFAASVLSDVDGLEGKARKQVIREKVDELQKVLEAHRRVPSFQPVRLADQLTLEEVSRFSAENLEYSEFEIVVENLRFYRHAIHTSHLLGYLGEATAEQLGDSEAGYRSGDRVGKKGVEGQYETLLRGERGEQIVVVDSRGRPVDEHERLPSDAGRDLRLTIDLELQQAAAQQFEDKVGALVALDPRNGEVLALVSSPGFDPNDFAKTLPAEIWRGLIQNPHHPMQNRAIQNAYPPGSVFKIVMALAALQEGVVHPTETTAFCRGFSTVYNNRYRCWKAGGHGRVDLAGSLVHSCNVYYHQLAQKLDIEVIGRYARMFGLGEVTGLDLAGEKRGLVPSNAWSLERRGTRWYPGETISVATGQGPILVTPLQAAALVATVANGGRPIRPHLVRQPNDRQPNDPLAPGGPGPERLPIDPEHFERVRRAMWEVVHDPGGTGEEAFVEGFDVAGKTGTAQVVQQTVRTSNDELPPELRDHAWFAAFAPLDDPQLVVVVFVEHGGAGSSTAAPIARAVYETFFGTDVPHRTPAG